ncbi:4-hydroxybenzoate polyprenyl transferase [Testicularia cyperi]|uniref:4-hydroxybenzoate polyprenyltransferase, mitochondrial n=1 Tax=Testicularia cyperi TaxID=1882483 RepID=A0A317XR89_9BASI|nr:4-hydroxybenzoate polyprenyl transferase [Testicularia cyperi]
MSLQSLASRHGRSILQKSHSGHGLLATRGLHNAIRPTARSHTSISCLCLHGSSNKAVVRQPPWTKSVGATIPITKISPLVASGLQLRCYATTPAGVKTTYPSSAPPADENSEHHTKRLGTERDQGYLAFTKSSLFKLTLPLQPPSPDPSSPSSKLTSAKSRAQRNRSSQVPESDETERQSVSSQPWEQAAETDGPPVSQVNHRPHHNLHGPENGEPSDIEADEYDADAPAHSVVFLLHSAQPLSYIANLIRSEGPSPEPSKHQLEAQRSEQQGSSEVKTNDDAEGVNDERKDKRHKFSKEKQEMRELLLREGFLDPLGDPPISFHTRAADGKRWSPATGIGDFLRDAARIGSFVIRIGERNVSVTVPSFEDRTRFLRASLYAKTEQIESMVKLKKECDEIAHSGTKRLSFAGVGILAAWWGSVAFLTFGTELGWDVMEPVTYLTGLGTILGGYVWFLIHNREVSYRAVLNETTSRRQQKLYIEKGFNIERYQELIEDVKDLRKTIKKVAEDYDLEWDQSETRAGKQNKQALKIIRKHEAADFKASRKESEEDEEDGQHEEEDKDGDGQPDSLQDDKAKLKTRSKKKNGSSSSTSTTSASSSSSTSIGSRTNRGNRSVHTHARTQAAVAAATGPFQRRAFSTSRVARLTDKTDDAKLAPSALQSASSEASSAQLPANKPFSLRPYLQLSRIDKPIGTWLLFWPCAWSIVLASHTLGLPISTPIFYTLLFGVGAIVMRGAGCTINDMWDVKMDRMVERTKTRPLAAGDVTQFQALCFLGVQLSAGLAVLINLNWFSIVLGASSLSVVVLYPLMKRITYWPQLVLGLAFNWGAMLGWAAVAGSVDWAVVLPLYAGSIFWTLVYDTIYAHQDKTDDVKAGVKSTALLFGEKTRPVLSTFSAATISLFGYSASQAIPPAIPAAAVSELPGSVVGLSSTSTGAGGGGQTVSDLISLGLSTETIESLGAAGTLVQHHPGFSLALVAAASHLAWQIRTVDLNSRPDCWAKFVSNTNFGWIVFAGLVADYAAWTYLDSRQEPAQPEQSESDAAVTI